MTKSKYYELSYLIIGCAIEVHKFLGPGLLESVYAKCFKEELKLKGLNVKSQVILPITYKDISVDGSYVIDLLVEDLIIVELKAVETMIPLFKAQLLTYLKLSQKCKGLLINFNTEVLNNQVFSVVTEGFRNLPE